MVKLTGREKYEKSLRNKEVTFLCAFRALLVASAPGQHINSPESSNTAGRREEKQLYSGYFVTGDLKQRVSQVVGVTRCRR